MRENNLKFLRRLEGEQKFTTEAINKFIEQVERPLKNDNDINRVEICILKYNRPDCEKECVANIIDQTPYPYKLNLFDNRPNSGNMSKIWNKLIKESTCEYVLIMDSDAFVQNEYWLEGLVECFTLNRDCAVAVPLIGKSGGPMIQQGHLSEYRPEPLQINGHASGFCFLTKKSIMEELGYFDEDFYIFGQDSEMFERIMQDNKYKIYLSRRSLVHHGKDTSEVNAKDGENIWSFSNSTRKASEAGEFDWGLDTMYCQQALQMKFNNNYYPRNK